VSAADHISRRGGVPMKKAGFTLIELLVVIVILGVAAGMVSLSVAPSEERLAAMEVDRLAALFRLAQNEARVSGRPLTWQADANGYRFVTGETVHGATTDDPLRPRNWPFLVQRVEAPKLVFGSEPLLPPGEIRIATPRGEMVLALDAFGTLRRVQ
jgi:general secretion pathway protein H